MNQAFTNLQQFARKKVRVERCDLCSTTVHPEHQHLLEPKGRQVVCACDACAILFSDQQNSKYKRVPRSIRFLPNFNLTDAQWDELMIPINMAFFFYSSPEQRIIAMYPSPAGATESLLRMEAWQDIVASNPILEGMAADVEALLVNRLRDPREYFAVPIDECFKLVGLIRARWRGLSGGSEVWKEINDFFQSLKERCLMTQ
jgi:hypothetical protein